MKKNISSFVLCLLSAFILLACGAKEPVVKEKGIAFASSGNVDQALFVRVKNFVASNYRCPIRSISIGKGSKEAPGSSELKELMAKNDVCMLVLVESAKDASYRESVMEDLNIALLNITDLRKVQQSSKMNAEERFARRVEKESMRLIGRLLGLDDCPMARCALCLPVSEMILDTKGRNLCPPCQEKAQKALVDKGVKASF